MESIFIVSVHQLECLYENYSIYWHSSHAPPGYQRHYINVAHCRLVNIYERAIQKVTPITRVYSKLPSDVHRPRQGMITDRCLHSSMSNTNYPWISSTRHYTQTEAPHENEATDRQDSLLSSPLLHWSDVTAMSITCGREIAAKFLRCFQPHPPNFYDAATRMDKS